MKTSSGSLPTPYQEIVKRSKWLEGNKNNTVRRSLVTIPKMSLKGGVYCFTGKLFVE